MTNINYQNCRFFVTTLATGIALSLLLTTNLALAEKKKAFEEFETLKIILEINETDGDAEIVLNFKADEGIKSLSVKDPSTRLILDLQSRDRNRIGVAQAVIESAEPSIDGVLIGFPEGDYRVTALTVSGRKLLGTVTLSHDILRAPSFSPSDGEVVNPNNTVISWSAVSGAAGYIVEIEQDELGFNLTTKLSPDVLNFTVPAGILRPGIEYEVGVATVSPNGNVAVAEGSFITPE